MVRLKIRSQYEYTYPNMIHGANNVYLDDMIVDTVSNFVMCLKDYIDYGVVPNLELLKYLDSTGDFPQYKGRLGKIMSVTVNDDDYLLPLRFDIKVERDILPPFLYLYGKKGAREDQLFVNVWVPAFIKTIEQGRMVKYSKFDNPDTISIGLPYDFRRYHFERLEAIEYGKQVHKLICRLFNIPCKKPA